MLLAAVRRMIRTRRLAWVLAWALLLPVAQWASAAHALTHLGTTASEQRDPAAPAPAVCDICVVAAAIGGAAPVAEQPVAIADLPSATPSFFIAPAVPRGAPPPSYRSRAPPSLHA
jgi:hypothetical protein